MIAERKPPTDYAPNRIGDEVSSRVQSIVSSVLANADIEGRQQLSAGISGDVEVYGQTVPYNLRASTRDGAMVATLRLTDEKERSAKVSKIEFIVTPRTRLVKPEGSWLKKVFGTGEFAFTVETNFDRGTKLTYTAGKKVDNPLDNVMSPDIPNTPLTHMTREFFGPTLDSAIDTSVVLKDADGHLALSYIEQLASLTNPELGHPYLRGVFRGTMTDTNDFVFAIGVLAADEVGEKGVAGMVYKVYMPSSGKSGITYTGKTLGLDVIQGLPDPIRVNPLADEANLTGRGRKNAGRIESRMPKSLSEGQVSQMLANLLQGRVFVAGVWNPLEITGSRRVSKPLSK